MGNDTWCSIDESCSNLPVRLKLALLPGGAGNDTGTHHCSYPFCVKALYYTINDTPVRVYDLVLVTFSFLFLAYLLLRLLSTIKKLHGSLPLFKILYVMVFLIPVVSCVNGGLAMARGYYSTESIVSRIVLRGAILMTELSVVIFGLFFKYYNNKYYKLVASVIAIVVVSIVFTVLEGVLQFVVKEHYACDGFKFFAHGGLLFLFSTSTAFAVAYLLTFMLYMFNLHKRWNLPSKKSFYRYALFLSVVNVVQAVGSMMWYKGKENKHLGHVGICLTMVTNLIYVATFAPVVYWIFLSNYFRMNKSSLKDPLDGPINVNGDTSQLKRRSSSTTPIHIGGRRGHSSYFEEQTNLFAGSFSSSYGSVNDDEEYVRTEYSNN